MFFSRQLLLLLFSAAFSSRRELPWRAKTPLAGENSLSTLLASENSTKNCMYTISAGSATCVKAYGGYIKKKKNEANELPCMI